MRNQQPHFRSAPSLRSQQKNRKIGRYVLLVLLIGITAPWWIKLFPKSNPSTETVSSSSSSSSSKKKKTSSSSALSSSVSSSSSQESAAPSSVAPSLWQETKTAQGLQLSRSFNLADSVFDGHPAIHGAFVAHVLAEARSKCGSAPLVLQIQSSAQSPFYERAYEWKCAQQSRSYTLYGNPIYGLWIDSQSCRKGFPCLQKAMADYIPQESVPGQKFLRYMPGVSSVVLAPENLNVLEVSQQGGAIQLLLTWGYSWKILVRGLLSTPLKPGQKVTKGSSLGNSRTQLPLEIHRSYQGQPISWAQASALIYPAGVKP